MTWLAVIRALISLASNLASLVRDENLMSAGDARTTAKSLAALSARLGIGNEVAAEVAALSGDDLNADLRGD